MSGFGEMEWQRGVLQRCKRARLKSLRLSPGHVCTEEVAPDRGARL